MLKNLNVCGNQQPIFEYNRRMKATKHGARGMYAKGCRCDTCKAGNRKRHKEWRDSTGYQPTRRQDFEASDFPHGMSGYTYGCRCDACKAASVERIKTHRCSTHGMSGYNSGCRCETCRKAKKAYDSTPERRAARREHVRRRCSKIKASEVVNPMLIKRIYQHCPDGYEVDHIKAIARGGLHDPDNLQYLPATINRRKHTSDADVSEHLIRWQDLLETGSTTIP